MPKTIKIAFKPQEDSAVQFMDVKREDYHLIDRFLSGDEQGFEMIVRKYQDHVINIAYSLVGQTYHLEDITQEVFIKVFENLSSFKKRADFTTWLYRIAVNTTYNYMKKEKRYASLSHIQERDIFKRKSFADSYSKEMQHLIREGLWKLPFKYRTMIVLRDIEGLSYKDIAEILACRIGTVESRLFRARSKLKKVLSPLLKPKGGQEI